MESVVRNRAGKRMLWVGGVVLLSPAAPSFGAYRNWEERSEDFTKIVHSLVG